MSSNGWYFLGTRGTRVSSSLAWFSPGDAWGCGWFVKLARVFPGTLTWWSRVAHFLGLRSSWRCNHFFQVRDRPWFTHRNKCLFLVQSRISKLSIAFYAKLFALSKFLFPTVWLDHKRQNSDWQKGLWKRFF